MKLDDVGFRIVSDGEYYGSITDVNLVLNGALLFTCKINASNINFMFKQYGEYKVNYITFGAENVNIFLRNKKEKK